MVMMYNARGYACSSKKRGPPFEQEVLAVSVAQYREDWDCLQAEKRIGILKID
jgi:hypothetical protein